MPANFGKTFSSGGSDSSLLAACAPRATSGMKQGQKRARRAQTSAGQDRSPMMQEKLNRNDADGNKDLSDLWLIQVRCTTAEEALVVMMVLQNHHTARIEQLGF
jgi:hypothetical protein